MASRKFPAILAVLGICVMTSSNSNAATHIFTNYFTTASSFIDDFKSAQFIRIRSVNNSFTSNYLFTAARSQHETGMVYEDAISDTYGKLLASLGLMALIAYRRSSI